MLSKTLSTAAVALAASTFVSAQTFTECDPTEKDCGPKPGYGNRGVDCDMTQGECKGFHELDGTSLDYTSAGALFRINKETDAPTYASDDYIFFGRLEVECEPAPGQGIVSSIVLQSDCLDEIDWEWIGSDVDQVQTNYYRLGDTTTYDRGAFHSVPGAIGSTKTYVMDWNPKRIEWSVDGKVVRTLTYEEAKGGANYPQTPMQIKIGTWVGGGKNSPEGTVEWAGGYTDFNQAPFDSIYKSIKVTDYAGGSSAAGFGVKSYVYGDRTGTMDSIVIEKGDGSSESESPKPTKSVIEPETSTKASEKTEETEKTEEPKTKTKSVIEPETSSEAAQSTVSVPTTIVTSTPEPSSSSTSEEGDATSSTATEDNDGAEETGPAEVPDNAAGSNSMAFAATFAVVGAAVLAQLF